MRCMPYLLSVFLLPIVVFASDAVRSWDRIDSAVFSKDIVHGEATMDGVFQVKCLPAAVITNLLPGGLSLKNTDLCKDGFHPALFFFGAQKNLRAVSKFGSVLVSKRYNESIMAVFSVAYENAAERFLYVTQIKVDSAAAWIFAQPYGGLNKNMSTINSEVGQQTIYSKDSSKLLASAKWAVSASADTNKLAENFNKIEQYFADRAIAKRGAGFTCFGFNWNFKVGKIKSSQLEMKLGDEYVSAALSGTYSDNLSLEDSPLGSFYSSNSWVMQLPLSCPQN